MKYIRQKNVTSPQKHRNNEYIEQKKIIIQINKKMCGGMLRNSSTSIVTMTIN